LWLNDSRPGEDALRVRVVGRRRHRTGKVAWYATNAKRKAFAADDILRLYFDRWPLQEHRFRDGNGRVGLDRHHGYGRMKIANVAVVDRRERLLGQVRRLAAKQEETARALVERRDDHALLTEALDRVTPSVETDREAFEAAIAEGGEALQERHRRLRLWEDWLHTTRLQAARLAEQIVSLVTGDTETVRIYDQPRDPSTMAAVRRACAQLTALGLTRGKDDEERTLRFEVVANPADDPPRSR